MGSIGENTVKKFSIVLYDYREVLINSLIWTAINLHHTFSHDLERPS